MRPMLASPATASRRRRVDPRGQVGRHAGPRRHPGRRRHLRSRNGNDVTAGYPELAHLGRAYDDMLLDGEVVALDGGRPSSERSPSGCTSRPPQGRAAGRGATGDADGVRPPAPVRLRPHRPAAVREARPARAARPRGPALAGAAGLRRRAGAVRRDPRAGLEGVVSKRPPRHTPGRRSTDWLKSPHKLTVSAVVGGWRRRSAPPTGSARCCSACPPQRADGGMRGGWARGSRARPRGAGQAAAPAGARHLTVRHEGPTVDADGASWVEPGSSSRHAPWRRPGQTAAPARLPRRAHRPDARPTSRRSTMPG